MDDITPAPAVLDAELALIALDAWDVLVRAPRAATSPGAAEPRLAALAGAPQLVYEQPGMAVIA